MQGKDDQVQKSFCYCQSQSCNLNFPSQERSGQRAFAVSPENMERCTFCHITFNGDKREAGTEMTVALIMQVIIGTDLFHTCSTRFSFTLNGQIKNCCGIRAIQHFRTSCYLSTVSTLYYFIQKFCFITWHFWQIWLINESNPVAQLVILETMPGCVCVYKQYISTGIIY